MSRLKQVKELFRTDHILFTFMPAPTLRLLLFDHKGLLLGEIRDQNMRWFMWMIPNFLSLLFPKEYVLINNKEEDHREVLYESRINEFNDDL